MPDKLTPALPAGEPPDPALNRACLDQLDIALNEVGLVRGATVSSVQRRLRVGAADAMRLLSLREAISAALSASVEPVGWQPIETAPRDNLKLHEMRAVGAWKHKTYGWIWGKLDYHPSKHHEGGGYFLATGGEPTLWMVLPPIRRQRPAPSSPPETAPRGERTEQP